MADDALGDTGTHKTGKSTLISRLASPTGAAPNAEEEVATGGSEVLDLGLSYSFLDVGDEADEGTSACAGGMARGADVVCCAQRPWLD